MSTIPNKEFELITSPTQKAQLFYELYKYQNGSGVKSFRRISDTTYEFDVRGKLLSIEDSVLVLEYSQNEDTINISYDIEKLTFLNPVDVALNGFDNKSLDPFIGKHVHLIATMDKDGALSANSFGFALPEVTDVEK